MTWQCWAFAHKNCTFGGFVVSFKNLQIRVAYGKVSFTLTGRLYEKQFIVCNFKVTIRVAPSRLMGRLGEVVAHAGLTVSQIPLQGFPSPVYPSITRAFVWTHGILPYGINVTAMGTSGTYIHPSLKKEAHRDFSEETIDVF